MDTSRVRPGLIVDDPIEAETCTSPKFGRLYWGKFQQFTTYQVGGLGVIYRDRRTSGNKRSFVAVAVGVMTGGLVSYYSWFSCAAIRRIANDTEFSPATSTLANGASHSEPSSPVRLGVWGYRFVIWVDCYVLEPCKIALRMAYLFALFLPLVVAYPLGWFGPSLPEYSNETACRMWWYQLVTSQMARAGPTFIKLSQWAASRADLFPSEFCHELSRLHSGNNPHAFQQTRRMVEHAFDGWRLEDVFELFETEPLGTGAIAQVYRAKFRPGMGQYFLEQHRRQPLPADPGNMPASQKTTDPSGSTVPAPEQVAIKVLHPRVAQLIRRDLVIIGMVAAILDWVPNMQWVSFPDEVAKFGDMMQSQLDLRVEAANLLRFRHLFRDRPEVRFSYAWKELCTSHVLVEAYEDAVSLELLLRHPGTSFDHRLAGLGLNAFLMMVIYDNFIHADLHPGNILVSFTKPEGPHYLDRLVNKIRGFSDHNDEQRALRTWYHKAQQMTMEQKEKLGNDNANTTTGEAIVTAWFPEEPLTTDTPLTEKATQSLIHSTIRQLANRPSAFKEYMEDLADMGFVPQLIFLDTGLVASLNETDRRNFLDLFQAIAQFDGYRTGQLMVERCRTPQLVLDPDIFALKMQHLILLVRRKTLTLSQVSIGDLLREVMVMVRQHHVKLEGRFVNVVLSILILEGIGRQLDPNLDLLKVSLPLLRSYGLEQSGKATLDSVRHVPQSGIANLAWWIKVWLWLEAREWIHNLRQFEMEDVLFGKYMYPDV
ncbi:hypothetical protein IWQ61_003983 [Dispira simplex]|nr:hypothetical protein IWQ61_003983 [Dispira simplex]